MNLAGLSSGLGRFWGRSISLTDPLHSDRIRFSEVASTPALDCHRGVRALVQEYVARRDWLALAHVIEAWDQARARCPMNRRLLDTALAAMAQPFRITQPGSDRAPVRVARIPDALVLEVVHLSRDHPDNYVLRALAAQLRLWQAWDFRGGNYVDTISEAAWARAENAADQAAELIEPLDADALGSPLVALVRFNLLPFDPEGARVVLKRYEARVRLDPSDLTPHYDVGRYLLPRWFGSYETVETTARQAVVWTQSETGLAAYAALYNGALETETAPMGLLDAQMFAEGTDDLIVHRHRDPCHVPLFVQGFERLSQAVYPADLGSGSGSGAEAHWRAACVQMNTLASRVLQDHLTAIHPGSWVRGTAGALRLISTVMQEDLAQGAYLVMDRSGLRAVAPSPVHSLQTA